MINERFCKHYIHYISNRMWHFPKGHSEEYVPTVKKKNTPAKYEHMISKERAVPGNKFELLVRVVSCLQISTLIN